MDYQQEYLPHDYIELSIPPGRTLSGEPDFLLDPNHLHIWPRHSFMLIALPNKVSRPLAQTTEKLKPYLQDKSFTCTLFAPTKDLDGLDTTEKFLSWFEVHFSDAVGHIGRDRLAASFERNPRNSLICVKVRRNSHPELLILIHYSTGQPIPLQRQSDHHRRRRPCYDTILRTRPKLRPRGRPSFDEHSSNARCIPIFLGR